MPSPLTVLVVDDHAHAREVISRLLEAEGYGVVIAANGAEAIQMLESNANIGAVGNLIDRVRLGRVTDFIHFPHWPNFNVADSSIFVGVAIILAGYLLFGETKPAS